MVTLVKGARLSVRATLLAATVPVFCRVIVRIVLPLWGTVAGAKALVRTMDDGGLTTRLPEAAAWVTPPRVPAGTELTCHLGGASQQ
jgi:hypothetical protein